MLLILKSLKWIERKLDQGHICKFWSPCITYVLFSYKDCNSLHYIFIWILIKLHLPPFLLFSNSTNVSVMSHIRLRGEGWTFFLHLGPLFKEREHETKQNIFIWIIFASFFVRFLAKNWLNAIDHLRLDETNKLSTTWK